MDIKEVAKWFREILETGCEPCIFCEHTDLKGMAEACERFTWRPIETAPKDKTILLHMKGGGIDIGFWNGRSWDEGDYYDDMGKMTHWMPLPDAPQP